VVFQARFLTGVLGVGYWRGSERVVAAGGRAFALPFAGRQRALYLEWEMVLNERNACGGEFDFSRSCIKLKQAIAMGGLQYVSTIGSRAGILDPSPKVGFVYWALRGIEQKKGLFATG
jgi:hypothetical protein